MTDLVAAVRKLRAHLGISQQAFSNRLGLSLRAIANYEKDRTPTGKVLMQLWNLAEENNLPGPAKVFQEAMSKELGHDMKRAHIMERFNHFLETRLCAHEGGAPSVSIGYDDATFCYVITQKKGFGSDSASEVLGCSRSLVRAIDLAVTGEVYDHE